MIKADFLTPNYDITFSQTEPKDKYKRRVSCAASTSDPAPLTTFR
jgi:hypothetical protein